MVLMVLQCHARILINQNHVEMEDFVNPPVKQLYRVALDETPSFAKGNKAMRDKLLLRAWMVSFKKVLQSILLHSDFMLFIAGLYDAKQFWRQGRWRNGSSS